MTTTAPPPPQTHEPDATEQFAERMTGIANDAALAMMISIGHRTGLFDTLEGMQPETSAAIAAKAGLDERYVREWLGAMVTGGIVTCDDEARRFVLPAAHAVWLTRRASPQNSAVATQFISLLGAVEDQIVDCFENGGGVPYAAYPRFHTVMAEESAQTVVAALDDHILTLSPGLIERLESGIDVLDIGCGAGRALAHMARRFPNSRFTGYDFSGEAIARAQEAATTQGLANLSVHVRDLAAMDEPAAFDLITAFDVIHDQAAPAAVLDNVHTALRDDGVYLMQDIGTSANAKDNMTHPLGTLIYTISCMHCMTVSLADEGAGLGAAWGWQTALKMLGEAGFQSVERLELPHDPMNCFFVCTKR